MYQCVITFHHNVDHGDLDSITRLTSLEHTRLNGYFFKVMSKKENRFTWNPYVLVLK